MRRLLAWGLGAAGAGSLLSSISCGPDPTAAPTALPTPLPTDPPTAAALRPTFTPRPVASPTQPSPTDTVQPTDMPEPTDMVQPPATSEPAATREPTARPSPAAGDAYLALARGEDTEAIVQAALRALGGIERFVKSGDDVIIKPNICVAYHTPEYAATTNPQVVGALVRLCMGAGAKRVRVMDHPFGGSPAQAYARSGIGEAVQAAGGSMEVMAKMKYRSTPIPEGRDIREWSVYQDALKADVFISVPIAKNHGLAMLTLGMKNLMGVIENRSGLHINLGQRIADITSLLRPTLTVVDAVRILVAHGPTGGSLDDVKLMNTVIASHDIVAADAAAATLFGRTGANIPATAAGAQMGLGTMDLGGVKVEEISL
jgi:uncharacterized protein (DUF362 family)